MVDVTVFVTDVTYCLQLSKRSGRTKSMNFWIGIDINLCVVLPTLVGLTSDCKVLASSVKFVI